MFQFKQFTIQQDRCAMKVGTDGVLLGAWAEGGSHILDIGTGTGLIACMMAQRFPQAQVEGIEIDSEASEQAKENVAHSPFCRRISITNLSVQDYTEVCREKGIRFDSIVCNPPYFSRSLKTPLQQRNLARHADSLPAETLFKCVKALLEQNGVFSLIIPKDQELLFMKAAIFNGFFTQRIYNIKTTPKKAPKRLLISFTLTHNTPTDTCEETLQDLAGERSPWYAKITNNFYL